MKLWIARDKSGGLRLYYWKPERYENIFYVESKDMDGDELYLQDLDGEYDSVTWENSPQEVELKLKQNENK